MSRFHFNLVDNYKLLPDETGTECADVDEAREFARRALFQIASERLPKHERRSFEVSVTDENGQTIYLATLTFKEHRVR